MEFYQPRGQPWIGSYGCRSWEFPGTTAHISCKKSVPAAYEPAGHPGQTQDLPIGWQKCVCFIFRYEAALL